MEKKDNTENAPLSEAQNRTLKHWKSYNLYRRKGTVEGWHCGGAMEEVFQELPHGRWGDWLESVGISRSTADRLRQLSKSYDITQIEQFDSVDEALKAIRKRKKPDVKTQGEIKSVEKAEEATGGEGIPQSPDGIESAQETQKLPDKLSETEDQLPDEEKEVAELRREKTKWGKEKTDLLKEIERLKRLLEKHGISWELPSDDQQKEYPPAA